MQWFGEIFSPTHFFSKALHFRLHWRLPWDQRQCVSCIKVLFRSGTASTGKTNLDKKLFQIVSIFFLPYCRCEQLCVLVLELQKIYLWQDSKAPQASCPANTLKCLSVCDINRSVRSWNRKAEISAQAIVYSALPSCLVITMNKWASLCLFVAHLEATGGISQNKALY